MKVAAGLAKCLAAGNWSTLEKLGLPLLLFLFELAYFGRMISTRWTSGITCKSLLTVSR